MVHCRLFFDVLSLILEQVDNRDSFENVSTKWMAEIHENCPGVKMVLTALKCDLRKDEEQNENPDAVTFDEGLAKAKEVGAVKYLGTLCCVVVFFVQRWKSSFVLTVNRMLGRSESRDSRDLL